MEMKLSRQQFETLLKLADRDFSEAYRDSVNRMDQSERFERLSAFVDKYETEFEEHGVRSIESYRRLNDDSAHFPVCPAGQYVTERLRERAGRFSCRAVGKSRIPWDLR
jgi:hypothetical protein